MVMLRQLGIIVGVFTVLSIVWIAWLKVKLRGRIYARFFDATNYESGELIKISVGDAVPTLKSPTDDLDYLIDVNTQTQMHYPPGVPIILQEPVPVQHYVRGTNMPYNPRMLASGNLPGTSAAALSNIKNQEYAKSMVERLNDELGGGHFTKVQKLMTMGLLGLGGGLAVVGFMIYQMSQQMDAIRGALGV